MPRSPFILEWYRKTLNIHRVQLSWCVREHFRGADGQAFTLPRRLACAAWSRHDFLIRLYPISRNEIAIFWRFDDYYRLRQDFTQPQNKPPPPPRITLLSFHIDDDEHFTRDSASGVADRGQFVATAIKMPLAFAAVLPPARSLIFSRREWLEYVNAFDTIVALVVDFMEFISLLLCFES